MPHEPVSDAAQRQRVLMQAKASRSLPVVDGVLYAALGILLVPQVVLPVRSIGLWCLCIVLVDSARSWMGFHAGRHIDTINVRNVTPGDGRARPSGRSVFRNWRRLHDGAQLRNKHVVHSRHRLYRARVRTARPAGIKVEQHVAGPRRASCPFCGSGSAGIRNTRSSCPA